MCNNIYNMRDFDIIHINLDRECTTLVIFSNQIKNIAILLIGLIFYPFWYYILIKGDCLYSSNLVYSNYMFVMTDLMTETLWHGKQQWLTKIN